MEQVNPLFFFKNKKWNFLNFYSIVPQEDFCKGRRKGPARLTMCILCLCIPVVSLTDTRPVPFAQVFRRQWRLSNLPFQVLHLLEQEEYRSQCYVHGTTVKKVAELCQKVMVDAHKDKLHAVCHDLITNEDKKGGIYEDSKFNKSWFFLDQKQTLYVFGYDKNILIFT